MTKEVNALELKNVEKSFGSVLALQGVTLEVAKGSVTCVLGDNGAGKSTLIKILSGVHKQSKGEFNVAGKAAVFDSPRDALANGIATVFQDLATIPLMSVWRNFFLGNEIRSGFGPFKWLNVSKMKQIAKAELLAMGIDLRDVNQPIGTLSGGERQSLAIARAVYFGAKVLILDEPTAALGVKEATHVLRLVMQARNQGIAVVLVTHNVLHAMTVGDHFAVLIHGKKADDFAKGERTREQITDLMAGGEAMAGLEEELNSLTGAIQTLKDK